MGHLGRWGLDVVAQPPRPGRVSGAPGVGRSGTSGLLVFCFDFEALKPILSWGCRPTSPSGWVWGPRVGPLLPRESICSFPQQSRFSTCAGLGLSDEKVPGGALAAPWPRSACLLAGALLVLVPSLLPFISGETPGARALAPAAHLGIGPTRMQHRSRCPARPVPPAGGAGFSRERSERAHRGPREGPSKA